jgi:subtilisin family serine protease
MKFTAATANRLPEDVSDPLEYLRDNAGLKAVQPLFSERRIAHKRASVSSINRAKLAVMSSVSDSEIEELRGIILVSLRAKKKIPELVKHLKRSRTIDYAEPMPARWLAANAGGAVNCSQNLQWGLRAIHWFNATIPSAADIRVGVLDTGIDEAHPDLRKVDINYYREGLKKRDKLGHGTHVAGIIAATANNKAGITGVARCKLSMWKIFEDQPAYDGGYYVDSERYLRALGAVRDEGVKVVNLSIGGTKSSETEQILFRRLTNYVVVVAAMGNEYERGNPMIYPAAYDGVLAVGSIAEDRLHSDFANTGDHIDLVAPGSNILSTLPTSNSKFYKGTHHGVFSGTSMATPHVAAAAALVSARFPSLNVSRIKDRLTSKTELLNDMDARYTEDYGHGLLNLIKALR